MIIFRKLRYKNFLSTGNHFTEIDLGNNERTLIIGQNGAGKSTMIEALCYGLFGKSFRNVNKGQLINSINKKDLLVEVEFSIGGKNFKIRRGMKPNIFELYQDDNMLNQTSSSRDYQEYLEQNILLLNFKSFTQIVILSSSNFIPFMKLPAGNRREIIEDLLDINVFTRMNQTLKSYINDLKEEKRQNSEELRLVSERITLEEQHLEYLEKKQDEKKQQLLEQKKQDVSEISTEQKEVVLLQESREKLAQKLPDIDSLRNKYNLIQNDLRNSESEKNKYQREIIFYKDNSVCNTCKQEIVDEHRNLIIEKNTEHIESIQENAKELMAKIDKFTELFDKVEKLNKKISDIDSKINKANQLILSKNVHIQNIEEQLQDLEGEDRNEIIFRLKKYQEEQKSENKKKNNILKKENTYDLASVILKDSGIKTLVIEKYIPIINKTINQYLTSMDFFVNFELDNQFKESIKSRYRDEFSYENFSEGEKARIDLALIFTWRIVSRMRNRMNVNILILDEVFDSSLDFLGTEDLMKILDTLDKTNVFVISHKDEMKEKFENILRFEKQKNFSVIKGEI